jgi:hypothetical protein
VTKIKKAQLKRRIKTTILNFEKISDKEFGYKLSSHGLYDNKNVMKNIGFKL